MQDQRLISPGPYRATKLWGEVTRLFRAGMPVRRHRLHLRWHERCFTAAEAADWLHALLRDNRNFGPTVTREQTLQLLGKFLKNHVMEDVKGRWGSESVRDDAKLYRFPAASPAKSVSGASRQPLSERNSASASRRRLGLKPDAPLLLRSASPGRAKATFNPEEWRNVALELLCEALSLPSLAGLLDPATIDPANIARNVQGAGRRGLVTLQDDADDVPHWVLTAMKCLANWPGSEAGRSDSYPGFERDVFDSVSKHFCSLAEPLLTFPLYRLFVSVLVLTGIVLEEDPPARRERQPTEPMARRDQRWAPPPPARAPTPTPAPAHLPWASAENLLLSFTSGGDASGALPVAPFRRTAPVRVKRHESGAARRFAGEPAFPPAPFPPAPFPLHRGRSHHALAKLDEEEEEEEHSGGRWAPAQRCFSLDSLAGDGTAELPAWVRPVGRAESFLLKRQQQRRQQQQKQHDFQEQQQRYFQQQQQHDSQQQQHHHYQQQKQHHPQHDYQQQQRHDYQRHDFQQQQHHHYQQQQQYHHYQQQYEQQQEEEAAGNPDEPYERERGGTLPRPRSWHACFSEHAGSGYVYVAGGTSRSPPPERRSPAEPRPRVSSLSACERRMQAGRRRAASCADVHRATAAANAGWRRAGGGPALGASAGDLRATPSAVPSATPSPAPSPTAWLGVPPPASGPTLVPSPEGAGRESACVAALRVCCLLLPPPSRRRLQLVARMAARAIANGRLPPLHATRGTRAHMVELLAPCVLRARDGEGAGGDALASARLLGLLVDNHGEALFSIPEPLVRLARREAGAEPAVARLQELLEDDAPSPTRLTSHVPLPIRPITGSPEHPQRSASDACAAPGDRRRRSQEYPTSPPRLQQQEAHRARDGAKGPSRTRPGIKPPLLLLAMTKPFKRKTSLRC